MQIMLPQETETIEVAFVLVSESSLCKFRI